ncbi:MAG: hypothetical protein QOJ07_2963, partial [Thermoleophilaceae bacterium]|nr:hypothetical protein [Thermoleophilaceae bacterium]
GLDQIATDELLGGPRRGKEDLLAEAEAVTAASAAGALRAALDTQLVLAPAGTARPDRSLAGYPWFSPSAVTGAELRPAGAQPRLGPRRPSPRLVVGPDGVSHEGLEPGTISTVRYSDLAAALQEPDGSLTLVGRDAAAVTLDVTAYPGARAAVAEVERRLPPELLVPPRAALAGGGHDLDALAGRKLARPARAAEELALLRGRLDEGESAVNLAEAAIGYKVGLLALTDRRVIWLYRGVAGTPEHKELPYDHVLGVRLSGRRGRTLTLASPVGETGFSDLRPRERGPELIEEIRRRAAQAGAPG